MSIQEGPVATHAIGLEAASSVAATLKALSDPLRLRMLSAIASDPRGESCVCDLAELAEVSQPTVSHHLKVLKDVDVLTSERRGTWVWYRITPNRRSAVTALLESFAPATLAPGGVTGDHDHPRPDFDARVTRLADELAAEIPDLDPDVVLTIVRESYTALARTARVTSALVPLTERFARQRLADLTRDRDASVPQVLFVCVANAGRSQLAAALVNTLAAGKVVARSAGSAPADIIHPHVRSILAEIEGDRAAERFPKPLTDDAVRAADVVITMGCGDVCPIIPGVRYDDWAVGDPALASREGVEAIRDDIAARVRALVDDLLS
ncbi:metalloregulator ArsR/SmtB family transcription factor [Microbacterium sp. KSW4-16]|uniref:metalloregulator ArsR/SmtB family transcription factor n=1 Tax=Microbacterium aurugineum TaxID=2851642 RepID=UPI0020C149E8|nr:metalloregulator ArsR/SmtB family transcription factor [Microbacterium aurugineum]MCK8468299.1 metalloregulator ArsR/SmtB family transcription factor [Microbacterium aurugineum]